MNHQSQIVRVARCPRTFAKGVVIGIWRDHREGMFHAAFMLKNEIPPEPAPIPIPSSGRVIAGYCKTTKSVDSINAVLAKQIPGFKMTKKLRELLHRDQQSRTSLKAN